MRRLLQILVFFNFLNSYSQSELKKVLFEIYYENNKPIPAGNLIMENDIEFIGTQTDSNGKAEMYLKNFDTEILLEGIELYVKFKIPEKTDLVKINMKKKQIKYYSKNRVLKKEEFETY